MLACVYTSPKACLKKPFLDKFEILLGILSKLYKNIFVVGDININVLAQTNVFKRFNFILDEYKMRYLVDFPTRITIVVVRQP